MISDEFATREIRNLSKMACESATQSCTVLDEADAADSLAEAAESPRACRAHLKRALRGAKDEKFVMLVIDLLEMYSARAAAEREVHEIGGAFCAARRRTAAALETDDAQVDRALQAEQALERRMRKATRRAQEADSRLTYALAVINKMARAT